ncbi:MAG: hypothetical protein KAS38_03095, partial [Anaerolineales bacterium]|nr:hypothetical protein [Anaerolineales bacterium]
MSLWAGVYPLPNVVKGTRYKPQAGTKPAFPLGLSLKREGFPQDNQNVSSKDRTPTYFDNRIKILRLLQLEFSLSAITIK